MSSKSSNKFRKIAAWGLTPLFVIIVILITMTVGWRPVLGARSRPLTNRRYDRTPERLARGKYLVEGVAGCFDCHSQAPKQFKAGEAPEFTQFGAGRVFINEGGLVVPAPNITPDVETGAGTWTDDQLGRAIREGIGHDGRTLFPAMPYDDFKYLGDEDLASIIVYLRSLQPIHNELPKRQIPFPLSRLINAAPQPIDHPVAAAGSDKLSRGFYLTRIGHCVFCHTPRDSHGQPLPGMEFAGGAHIGGFPAATANITPDPSGISYYDEALFTRVLRTGWVGARPLNPPMPWWTFRHMNDGDLKSIFFYLQTVKPVHNTVDNSELASKEHPE